MGGNLRQGSHYKSEVDFRKEGPVLIDAHMRALGSEF